MEGSIQQRSDGPVLRMWSWYALKVAMSGKKAGVLGGVLGCSSLGRHENGVERLETEQQELNRALEPCRLGTDCLTLARDGRRIHKAAKIATEDELSFRAYVALARR